ncbi:MAG TPA: SRPBCC domain-containing protein [Chloroflexota bacterium]|nr:SRPBCC domain-containing protein [Chloroflexota bacterium]
MADNNMGGGAGSAGERELVLTRVFDAPRELVFKAWTEPERMMRWWGPKGFTTPYCTIDLRLGGAIHFLMRSPEGQDIWCKGVYREIVEPERVVCTSFFSDEEGNLVQPEHYGLSPDWPAETVFTVTFDEHEGKTKLTMRQVGVPYGAGSDGAQQGWSESFDRLAEYVAAARA